MFDWSDLRLLLPNKVMWVLLRGRSGLHWLSYSAILLGFMAVTGCGPSPLQKRDKAYACNLLETPNLFLGKELSVVTAIDQQPDGRFIFFPSCNVGRHERSLQIKWRAGAEPPVEVWRHYRTTYAHKQPGPDNPPVRLPPFLECAAITGFLVADTNSNGRKWVFDGTGYESTCGGPM